MTEFCRAERDGHLRGLSSDRPKAVCIIHFAAGEREPHGTGK